MATEGLVRTGLDAGRDAIDAFARRHRYHPLEALPWAAAIAAYAVFPSYLPHMVYVHQGKRPRISIAFNLRKEPFP